MRSIFFMLPRLCLFLLVFTFTGSSMANAQDGGDTQAKRLWDQVIAAKGGRERLYSVSNLVVSERAKYKHPTGDFTGHHFESLFVLPDRWWSWADERGFGLSIWTYDFGQQVGQEVLDTSPKLWEYRPAQGKDRPIDGSLEAKRDARYWSIEGQFIEKQLIYLMETKWLRPTLVGAGTSRLKGQEVDVIETSYGRDRLEYYIDRKTHLPMKVIIRTHIKAMGGEYVDSFNLGDYVEVQGIKFPRVVSRGGEDSETTYQVNVAYDAGLFQRPPTIDMGPRAWELKK